MPGVQKTALEGVALNKILLQVGYFAAFRQPFDGLNVPTISLHREHQTTAHHGTVDAH